MWLLTVLHRHAVNSDYRFTERFWVECESPVRVCGVDGQYGLRQASRLCICGRVGLVSFESPRQIFNGFVKTNGENNGNHKSDHENVPMFEYKNSQAL